MDSRTTNTNSSAGEAAPTTTAPRFLRDSGIAFLLQFILVLVCSIIFVTGYAIITPRSFVGGTTLNVVLATASEVFPFLFGFYFIGLVIAWIAAITIQKFLPWFVPSLLPLKDRRESSSNTISDQIRARSGQSRNELLEADRLTVTTEIGARVEALRARTRTILAAMAVSLIAAAIIVLFAGRLTSLDASAVSNVDRINTDLAANKRRVTKLYQIQSLFEQADAARSSGLRETIDKLDRSVALATQDDDAPKNLSAVKLMINLETAESTRIQGLLNEAWQKELNAEKGITIGNI